jgi:hypothetical protein
MFRSLFRRCPRTAAPAARPDQARGRFVRPQVEALEERTLLSTIRTVVAVGLPVDGLTTFKSLAAALHASNYHASDIIQIEPGSAPGDVVNADLTAPAVTNLTIQGDPLVPLSTIPTFTVSDSTLIGSSESGIAFAHVNIGLVNSGDLDFFVSTQATITASTVTDYSSSAAQAVLLSGTSSKLTDSTFVNDANLSVTGDALVYVQPYAAGPNTNVITGNTFEGIGPTLNLLYYVNGTNSNLAVNDQVTNNTFLGNYGTRMFILTGSGPITGMTIADNTFTDSDPGAVAIRLDSESVSTQVVRNSISLTGLGSDGIVIQGGTSGTTTTSATIDNNQISTGGAIGAGLGLILGADGSTSNTLAVKVQGNDFHNNQYGIYVATSANGPLANIDLGGGSQGSIGGNDFRGFTTANANGGAIFLAGVAPASPAVIIAQRNIFGVSNPQTVVEGQFNAVVDTSNNLTGNAAFVETVYQDLFKRTGDTNNPSDAGSWVGALNNGTQTQAGVARGISYAPEALDFQVNALYLRLLGRTADHGGLMADVNYLAGGGTMEQIIINIATSPEFNSRAASNANFVESLYVDLLGRTADPQEVSNQSALLPTQGETVVVNGILTSAEFRGDVATELYGAAPAPTASVVSLLPLLLHRAAAPSPSEVMGWSSQGLGMLTIQVDFLAISEFFLDG